MPKQRRRGHGEGSIYQRKDGRWVAEVTLDDGKRKQLYAKTQAEAVAKRNQVLLDQKQGILAKGPKQTVKQYVEYWLEDVHRATLKVSTYALYRRHLNNHIIPELGYIQLQKLTADQIQAFYAKMLREGLSPNTIRLIHTILGTALKDAVKWKRIPINICDAVSPPRSQRHEILPLDRTRHAVC
jgi:integrase